jgi:hypothetical protein
MALAACQSTRYKSTLEPPCPTPEARLTRAEFPFSVVYPFFLIVRAGCLALALALALSMERWVAVRDEANVGPERRGEERCDRLCGVRSGRVPRDGGSGVTDRQET